MAYSCEFLRGFARFDPIPNGFAGWQDRKREAFSVGLTPEQKVNYVPPPFLMEVFMLRALMEEAAALASISLFLATIAVWAQLFSNF
jgi:hypothetical protein